MVDLAYRRVMDFGLRCYQRKPGICWTCWCAAGFFGTLGVLWKLGWA